MVDITKASLVEWPLLVVNVKLPCDDVTATLEACVLHLNDDLKWTREQIADWVETIERAEDAVSGNANQAASELLVPVPSAAP